MGAATIANYEAERTAPSLFILGRLAALYRVSCDWLVTGHPRLPHSLSKPHRQVMVRTAVAPSTPGLGTIERCLHGVPIRDRCPDCEHEAKEGVLGP